jgi:hypothetical protein
MWRAPAPFAACVLAAALLACLPVLALRHFDASVFVVAGDRYVDQAQTEAHLRVKPNSNGYDGQFYYRMALHPLGFAPREGGITFDHPAKRMERILFPALAWAMSLGHAAAAAWAMLGLNILGLGAIAWSASVLVRRLQLPSVVTLGIMLWPGFIVALLHDTTEIISTAFLLGALSAYLSGRIAIYAALAACAVLTRETTLPVFAGILVHVAFSRMQARNWRTVAACAAPFLPFAVWREVLAATLHEAPQANGVAHDLGWPFLGAARMLWACVIGTRSWASTVARNDVIRAIVLLTAPALLVFCAAVTTRIRAALAQGRLGGIPLGWVLTAALMSLLTANGPWVEPEAYFRAFTECYVVGWLVLAGGGFSAARLWVIATCGVEWVLIWGLCLAKLR